MMAMTISSVLIAGLLVAAYTLQRSFRASQHHITAQAQQMRLMDYMNLDLRRALKVLKAGDERLELTIPDYYTVDEDGDAVPRDPEIKQGTAVYGTTPLNVSYYREGGTVYREQGGVKQVLAEDVSDFRFDPDDHGQSISVSFTFLPRFQVSTTDAENARFGTTTYTTTLLRNKRQY